MSSDSDQKAAREFNEVLRDTVSSRIKRRKIKESIDKSVNDLSFLHPKLQLKKTDPSYTYRYVFAREFWKQETCGERSIDNSNLDELEKKLKKELEQKKNMFVEDTEEFEYSGDSRFEHKRESPKKVVACVALKGENKIFVKPLNGDDELQVAKGEISCSYNLVYPGDEVEVSVYSGQNSFGRDLKILKCNYEIPKSHIADFIEELKRNVLSEDSDTLSIFHSGFIRCKGVWDYLLRDKEPVRENVLSIIKISATLTWKLSRTFEESCKEFFKVFSCSFFFVNVLPKFIKESVHDSKSAEVVDLETLLLLMVELSPYAGKKIFEVAHCLADTLIDNPEQGKEVLAHERYHWGTQLLANLGEKLAKSVPGCQEVDTTHYSWRDAQTILTKKEIFSTHDISHLSPIRIDKPYDSEEQYLETNYRLLWEECYRNLYTGIQKFCGNPKKYDPKKVKIYRITLDSIFPTDSEDSIVLKYKGLDKFEDDSSQENDLIFGNLMCISLDKTFEAPVWATVGSTPWNEDSNMSIVNIKLFSERNEMEDGKILLKLHELTQKGDHALMAESPSFFQAFGPSMERLQEAGKQYALPFTEEIIFCKKSIPPDYTTDEKQECDWGIIFEESSVRKDDMKLQSSPIETYRYLKDRKIPTQLDDTQLRAIQVFLENRVSLIQGPPGTGKSFLGVKILRLMLSMKIHERYKGPILVMTYKNFALDHFLKECLKYWPRILRIGRSCKDTSDSLKAINLNKVRRNEAMRSELSRMHKEVMQKVRDSRSKLKATFENLKRFSLKSFIQGAKRCHIRSLLVESLVPISNSSRNKNDMENLLLEWDEESGFEDCNQDLKERIKDALNIWLPKEKLREKYKSYSKSKNESRVHLTKSEATGVTVDEDSEEESRDVRVIMDERLQDADERDDEISKTEDNHDAGDDDIDIPVMVDCNAKEEFERADITIDKTINLWKLEPEQRVDFVYALQYKVLGNCIEELTAAAQEYERNRRKRQEIMNSHTIDILMKYDVIGMTITGAAMRSKILRRIEPCAAIVEEAAEVLEGQLISVLPPTLVHLVMIGDQEQLKPAVTCYQLKKDKNFDCSMFERLIKNHLVHQQLGTQCRMRDDIAILLRKLDIYKDLETNKEKTRDNKPPKCIGESMYFFNHTEPEKDIPGTNSKCNQKEINKILEVSKHLVKNGVPPGDITVLSAYRGQAQQMEKEFKKASRDQTEQSFTKLEDIRITTIDSFQGEENKVILLSLVRSNRIQQIGFLAERNRICVAISRAQCALYIFGNASVYSKSKNWKVIIRYLEGSGRFGKWFPSTDDHEKPHLDDALGQGLSQRSIEIIASKIPSKWERLARLLNIEESVVEEILKLNCDPCSKAVKLLQKYRSSSTFDKSDLMYWLGWLDIRLPDDVLSSESNNSDRLEDGETVLNTTCLSPRERERLSLLIVSLWKRLAGLLNIMEEEVSNISLSNCYAEERHKAARMLALYNEKSYFSREDLGRYLEEVNCLNLKEQVLSGILRKR